MDDDEVWLRMRRRAWPLAALAFVGVTVIMLYPIESSGGPALWPHLDKVVHVGAWLALAVTLWPLARGPRGARRKWRALALVVALGFWGIAVELLQGLVPPRTPEAWDALADLVGASVGTLAMVGYEAWVGRARPMLPDRPVEQPIEETSP